VPRKMIGTDFILNSVLIAEGIIASWMQSVVGGGLLRTPMQCGQSVKEFLAEWLGRRVFVNGSSRGDLTREFVVQLSEDGASGLEDLGPESRSEF
jgi:hypothetical protein